MWRMAYRRRDNAFPPSAVDQPILCWLLNIVATGCVDSPRIFWRNAKMSVGMEAVLLLIPALVYP
jgi:hypothetical protein